MSKGDVIGKDRPYHHFTMKDEGADGRFQLCGSGADEVYYFLKERAKYFKEQEEGIMYLNPNLQKMVDNARNEERLKIIREMIISLLKEKSSFDFISKVTEASIDDIQKIQQEMNAQKKQ